MSDKPLSEATRRFREGVATPLEAHQAGVECAAQQIDELRAENERLRDEAIRKGIMIQNVWAVIDNLDNAFVSPTPDQRDVIDALRVALRKT